MNNLDISALLADGQDAQRVARTALALDVLSDSVEARQYLEEWTPFLTKLTNNNRKLAAALAALEAAGIAKRDANSSNDADGTEETSPATDDPGLLRKQSLRSATHSGRRVGY
ncbi:hypothetical protein MIND_00209800 [Mycena indigotica]|uniref:Uncharacterized protein n=1 Tax=Mycena indigotica TaxID=2126181 RepID=A0A8H6T9T8_9AGAR|nr:uncharacterized protein MIND_00209800 [Mycena indigotica]KAF7311980.1 hypothetical protein MIND_00209800 [Mycena indigotica]